VRQRIVGVDYLGQAIEFRGLLEAFIVISSRLKDFGMFLIRG
jgi:hypothetical protein